MTDVIDFPRKNKATALAPARVIAWAAQVRDHQVAIEKAIGGALEHAMDAGDILIEARRGIGHGGWISFLKDCGIPVRTAQVYTQLATNRSTITAANAQSSAHLSIAAALRLITEEETSWPKPAKPPKLEGATPPDPYSTDALRRLPTEERARLIANLGLSRVDVPLPIAAELVQRAIAQAHAVAQRDHMALAQCVRDVRSALATGAPSAHQVENVRDALRHHEQANANHWTERMAAESRYPINEVTPSTAPAVPLKKFH